MTRTLKQSLSTLAATGLVLGVMGLAVPAVAAPVVHPLEDPVGILQDPDPRGRQDPRGRDRQDSQREQSSRRVSEAEAQRIAQSRAGGARYVGYMGMRRGQHVFRFEQRDGRVIDIGVDAER
jgi:hypothetical protein